MLQNADRESTNHVDKKNEDTGHCIAANELAGAVHGAIEIGFPGDIATPLPGFILVDKPGIEVGIDRHLLAGHGVQGKPRGDLRYPPGALCDNNKIDNHQDGENHDTHGVATADDKLTEGLDNLASRPGPIVPLEQHHPG